MLKKLIFLGSLKQYFNQTIATQITRPIKIAKSSFLKATLCFPIVTSATFSYKSKLKPCVVSYVDWPEKDLV